MRTAQPAAGVGLTAKENDRGVSMMTGFVKSAWLLLYSEGGWWTAEEISKRVAGGGKLQAVRSSLWDTARDGFIVRQRLTNIDGGIVVQYGVTRKCKVPRGVTVDEMWDVLQMATKQPEKQAA